MRLGEHIGVSEIGIRAHIPQAGLLGSHLAPPSLEIHLRIARHITELTRDYPLQGVTVNSTRPDNI